MNVINVQLTKNDLIPNFCTTLSFSPTHWNPGIGKRSEHEQCLSLPLMGSLVAFWKLLPVSWHWALPSLPLLMVVEPLQCPFAPQLDLWNGRVTYEKTQWRFPSLGFPMVLCSTWSHSLFSTGPFLHCCTAFRIFLTEGSGQVLWFANSNKIIKLLKHFCWRQSSSLERSKGKYHKEGRIVEVNSPFIFFLFHNLEMSNRLNEAAEIVLTCAAERIQQLPLGCEGFWCKLNWHLCLNSKTTGRVACNITLDMCIVFVYIYMLPLYLYITHECI